LRPCGPFAGIFNKRLVALLFCVLYRRASESSRPSPLPAPTTRTPTPSQPASALPFTKRGGASADQLILDGLVCPPQHLAMPRQTGSVPPHPRCDRTKLHALSSFQRTKAPPVTDCSGFPATFAFASVAPFRGTFRAYDAPPTLSTYFSYLVTRPVVLEP
jgi:hypothetical protein